MVTSKSVNDMNTLKSYKLKLNPFRTTPASNPEEIIWAGFNEFQIQVWFLTGANMEVGRLMQQSFSKKRKFLIIYPMGLRCHSLSC